jgi:hypothetical protein
MPYETLAFFLIMLPIVEYIGLFLYTCIKDYSLMGSQIKLLPVTFIPLLVYQWVIWTFTKGLICPTKLETAWVPIVIFGINAFIYTVFMFIYLFFFSWVQTAKSAVVNPALTTIVDAKVPKSIAPVPTLVPTVAAKPAPTVKPTEAPLDTTAKSSSSTSSDSKLLNTSSDLKKN